MTESKSAYRIEQGFEYAGNDYWKWWSWIEASDEALDRVRQVVWILHESFSTPRVSVTDRGTKFRLDSSGWGTFRLRAELLDLNEVVLDRLSQDLRLEYPEEQPNSARTAPGKKWALDASIKEPPANQTSAAPRARRVFLSYGTEDAPVVRQLVGALEQQGLHVLSADRIQVGDVWDDAVARMIRSSDVVIGYVNPDFASPWVVFELKAAQQADKPVYAIVQSEGRPSGLPANITRIELPNSPEGARALSARIASLAVEA